MVEKVRKGVWVWIPPLGYERAIKGGNLVINEEIASYIRLAFEEYAKGVHTYRSLAQFLEKRGFRTRMGKKPCAQLMEKILRNPAYYGIIRAWGEEHKATFAPIIDQELFYRCQPGVKGTRNKARHSINPEFPLRKFVVCTHCQGNLTGSASTGRRGQKYPYYHHQKQGCPSAAFIPKETLEQNFVEYLQDISPKPQYEKIFKAVVLDVWQSNYKKLDSEHARIEKEIDNLKVERQRVFDLYRAHKFTDQEFLEQKDLVNTQIQQKEVLRDDKRVEEFDMEEALNYCFQFVRQSGKTWRTLEEYPELRARFQNRIFPEKVGFDGEKFGTKKMSLVYGLNQTSTDQKSQLVTLPGVEPGLTA